MAVQISFDLMSLHESEARSLIVMLDAFTHVALMTRIEDGIKVETAPAPETDHTPLFAHAEVSAQHQAIAIPVTMATPDPVVAPVVEEKASAPEPEVFATGDEPTKVIRRGRPKKVTVEEVPIPTLTPTESSKVFSVPELRDHLKNYTARHTVQDGIELLKDFGCNRVSEIAAIPQWEQTIFVDRCVNA